MPCAGSDQPNAVIFSDAGPDVRWVGNEDGFAGETNYNRFFGSLRIGFNGIFCFSTYALTLSTMFGFALAIGTFLFALLYLIAKLLGLFNFASGNPTIVILILFLGGIQLISVGILGEYIGRIYEEVRARPKFIVDRAEGFRR